MPTIPPSNDSNFFHLRIARPVSDLERTKSLYCSGLGLNVLSSFTNHAGFDGVILGKKGMQYHFEFTYFHTNPVKPNPTHEDLVVFYLPNIDQWKTTYNTMRAAGFIEVPSFNPYWAERGVTVQDHDGYRIVLQNNSWEKDAD